jgi:ureidoacrylate peracid hydrolase
MPQYDIEPSTTAFLVVDMTNDFLLEGAPMECPQGRDLIPRLKSVADACREAGIPVIYTTHVHRADGSDMGRMADTLTHLVDDAHRPVGLVAGTPGVEVHPELAPHADEPLIEKHRFSSFYDSDLQTILRVKDIETLIIGGVATNGCCESTTREASFRDYKVIFLSDGNATFDMPDMGFGPVSSEECQRVVLTTIALAFGEVTSCSDVVERVARVGAAA